MATIRKLNGKWQAQVARKGVRKSKSFATKQAAKDWASREEHIALSAAPGQSDSLFGDVMRIYSEKVTPSKRSKDWETRRLKALQRDPLAAIKIGDITPSDISIWRDRRMSEVKPGTVLRDWTLLSNIFSKSINEWGMIAKNPMSSVKRPAEPAARDRLVTQDELKALAISAGSDLNKATARSFHAFLFAIETAMRAGEIVSLSWQYIDLDKRVAHLPMTKNGTSRDVPLSSEAVRLLRQLPESEPVFNLTSASLSALWRKLRDRAGVAGLTFHDSRASAIGQLSKKVDVMDLARIVGHKNISQLMTYYRDSAEVIASRLD